MDEFPAFMQHPANRVPESQQATPGVEGYVFEGDGGTQMAIWTCHQDASSSVQTHEFDEYMIVVQGSYTLVLGDQPIVLRAGSEYFIPRGTPHSGKVAAGTRTIHAFAGRRVERATA